MAKKSLQRVSVGDFRSSFANYLYGETPVVVVRHGRTVGYYFPLKEGSRLVENAALQTVAIECNRLLEEQDISSRKRQ